MDSHYVHRAVEAPAASMPVKELGLLLLESFIKSLPSRPTSASLPALVAFSRVLENIAPLKAFNDLVPVRGPPEEQLILTAEQVQASSTRSAEGSTNYELKQALVQVPGLAAKKDVYWCSKKAPERGLSTITVRFTQPVQVTGLSLQLPAKLQPELLAVEVLPVKPHMVSTDDIPAAVEDGKQQWQKVGVFPSSILGQASKRLPVSAHNAVALRISMKGFASDNSDKYHALSSGQVFVANVAQVAAGGAGRAAAGSSKAAGGAGSGGSSSLFKSTGSVLRDLEMWLQTAGGVPYLSAAGGAGPAVAGEVSQEQTMAAVTALANLSLASGTVTSLLSLIQLLLSQEAALPAPTVHFLQSFIQKLLALGPSVGQTLEGLDRKSVV